MYENDLLTKYKARLVACGLMQVSVVDYREAHLYAPVVRLESFCALISIVPSSTTTSANPTYQEPTYMKTSMEEPTWSLPLGMSRRAPSGYSKETLRAKAGWRNLEREAQGRYGEPWIRAVSEGPRRIPHR